MRRALWFVAGAGAGVYAITRARRAAEVFTPDGLADRLAGLSVGARLFADEVRAGAADKENEMRQRVGVRFPELSAGSGAQAPEAADSPTGTEER
jgi:diacylglycerol kinase family enzyme